jgi:hypothetical protein
MKNYALITEGIHKLLLESYETKDKDLTKKILNEIKSNKKLQLLYTVVDNLKNGDVNPEYVDDFINENIKYAKNNDFSSFDTLLNESYESNDLIDSIGIILFESKTPFNLSKYTKAYDVVKTHLLAKNTWQQKAKQKLQEMNAHYVELSDEQDKALFESFIKSDTAGKKEIYQTTKKECINILNEHIANCNIDSTKLKLYETKDFIMSLPEDDNIYMNLAKLHELKKELL